MSDHPPTPPPRSPPNSLDIQTDNHVEKPNVAESTPSMLQARILTAQHSTWYNTHRQPIPLAARPPVDTRSDRLANSLNALIVLTCTILVMHVSLLTSNAPALTPTTRILNILGLVSELSGAVLVVFHLQHRSYSSEQARDSLHSSWWVSIQRALPITFILLGIVMFMAVVILLHV